MLASSDVALMIFDTGPPYDVIAGNSGGFTVADFSDEQDCAQVFLTWELPIDNPGVAQA